MTDESASSPAPEPRETPFPPEIEARRRTLVAQWRSRRAA